MSRIRRVLGEDDRGGMRAIAGLLLVAGTLALLIRRTSFEDPWGDFLVFLILFVLAELLFWAGFLGARDRERTLPWQTVFVVLAVLLTPLTLFAFVEWVGGDTDAPLNTAWIFLMTAAVAFLALVGARVRIGALLAGLALIVSWLALWAELLDDGLTDLDSVRWLFMAVAVILLVLAALVAAGSSVDGAGGDVVTAAGIAAVLAGGLTLFLFQFPVVPAGFGAEAAPEVPGGPNLFWDLELLLASLALVGFGASAALSRGPAYVGGFGLAAFIFSVGLDLDDSSPAGKVLGWPLILLLIGAALFLASVLPALRRRPS